MKKETEELQQKIDACATLLSSTLDGIRGKTVRQVEQELVKAIRVLKGVQK